MLEPPHPTCETTALGEEQSSAPGPQVLPVGTAVGRFFVLAHLAHGGMGTLYRAYDPQLDRAVALKLVRADRSASDGGAAGRERLLREARALARLSHPHVVTVYEVGLHGDEVFIAMEYVEGVTLREWLRVRRPIAAIVRLFVAAGEGLAAAHRAGLVHRDFKPDNVLVGGDERPRVLDFGLARPAAGGEAGGLRSAASTATGAGSVLSASAMPSAIAPQSLPNAAASGPSPGSGSPSGGAGAPAAAGVAVGVAAASAPAVLSASALSSSITVEGAVVGTPRYMAPEQLAGLPADARSDQFSFCVALYEALYRRLPYDGEARDAFRSGRPLSRPRIPSDGAVPRWLHGVLTRGLAPAASQRYPTMDALLAALRADPARRRGRALAAALGGALALASIAAVAHLRARESRVCQGAEAKLAGVWDEGRKAAVRQAFAASGRPYATDAFRTVSERLDGVAAAWARAHRDACEATRLRGEQSPELLDLRMACLERQRDELRARVEVLAAADGAVVERAPRAVQSLGDLSACSDAMALLRVVPPPADPATTERLAVVSRRLARARALDAGGRLGDAAAELEEARGEAKRIGYAPALADAHLAAVRIEDGLGNYPAARRAAEDAIAAAEVGRDDAAAARGFVELVWLLGERQRLYEEAHRAARFAEAKLTRLGQPAALLPPYHRALGSLLYRQARYDASAAETRKAIALLEAEGGSPHLLASLVSDLANADLERGRYEEARAHNERALALRIAAYGPDHPEVAIVLNNQGIVYKRLGQTEKAMAAYERALSIRERALGPEHPHTAAALFNLGELLTEQGRPAEALIFEGRARAIYEKALGPDHPDMGEILSGLAAAHRAAGRRAEAMALYRQAIALEERGLGADHPALATPKVGLGCTLVAGGEAAVALPLLERGVALAEASGESATALAEARLCLARALCEAGGDCARGRALAAEASAALGRPPPTLAPKAGGRVTSPGP